MADEPDRDNVPVPVDISALDAKDDEPPIVARMVIEIRSDGRRTVARGALEDRASGQTVAIQADAASPWGLARQLAGALFGLPSLARSAMKAIGSAKKRER